MFRYSLAVLLFLISSSCFAQKAVCAYERAQLKNIQAAMRTIYNSDSIIEEEQRRYANYQNCKENQKNKRKSQKRVNKPIAKNSFKAKKGYATSASRTGSAARQGRSFINTTTPKNKKRTKKGVLREEN